MRISTHDYLYKPLTLCELLLIFPIWDRGVTPTPLRCCPAISTKKAAGSQTVEKICHTMVLLCEGFDEEVVPLFVAIEAGHSE